MKIGTCKYCYQELEISDNPLIEDDRFTFCDDLTLFCDESCVSDYIQEKYEEELENPEDFDDDKLEEIINEYFAKLKYGVGNLI